MRARYRHFADSEAKGVSPLYVQLARTVSESDALLHYIATLPTAKQQPNLVFAAVRHLYGTPRDGQHFQELVEHHQPAISALILARSTQTNEPARCATLLPALAQLPQPLALLEVGASAGLCLLPDRWRYDYGRVRLEPRAHGMHQAPVFSCRANAATPLPDHMPEIVWRAGLDLNPLDLANREDMAWLETLVWPGQEQRAERLRAAVRVAQQPPTVVVAKGNLATDLQAVAATAPHDATLVIFHSAVLAYVARADRDRFIGEVRDLDAVWISNESPGVIPQIATKLAVAPPTDRLLLAVDGKPVAFTGPHGQSIDWLD
ncbi:MAG: DUF2332 domain-containing protein [Roseiflexaceae bacterium]|nr:DUF2332 domain-containing protein [Roseiflexaceae bacterium]